MLVNEENGGSTALKYVQVVCCGAYALKKFSSCQMEHGSLRTDLALATTWLEMDADRD